MARGSTDDLVVAPRFGTGPVVPSTPVDARLKNNARLMTGTRNKRQQGLLNRVVRNRIAGRLASSAANRLLGAQATAQFGSLARLGLIGGSIAAIGISIAKFTSDRTFEQMADEVSNAVFGTYDDDARARKTVREALAGDPFLAKVAYKKGSGELSSLFDGLVQSEMQRERSRSEIMRSKSFEVKGSLDLIFDGIEATVMHVAEARQADFEKFKAALHRRSSRSAKWGVR